MLHLVILIQQLELGVTLLTRQGKNRSAQNGARVKKTRIHLGRTTQDARDLIRVARVHQVEGGWLVSLLAHHQLPPQRRVWGWVGRDLHVWVVPLDRCPDHRLTTDRRAGRAMVRWEYLDHLPGALDLRYHQSNCTSNSFSFAKLRLNWSFLPVAAKRYACPECPCC